MDAIELLLNRSSQAQLQSPAPQGKALEIILKAGLRAPDHASLSPWQFIVVTGEGLDKLAKIYQDAAVYSQMSERDVERAPQLPSRAPMIIIALCKYKEHPKVPQVEQVAATSCAVQNMQMAALAQGFGGIWRTGSYAHNEYVRQTLNLSEKDEIVGFLYLGTPVNPPHPKSEKNVDDYVSYWS